MKKIIKKFWSLEEKYFVLWTSLFFYFSLYFSPRNRVFFLVLLTFLFVLWKRLGLKRALFVAYLLCLPFEKGKGFPFALVPDYLTVWNKPYEFWLTITFADCFYFGLLFLILREEIVKKWRVERVKVRKGDFFLFGLLFFSFFSVFFSRFRTVSFLGFLRLLRMVSVYFFIQKIYFGSFPLIMAASLFFQGVWATLQVLHRGPLGRDIEQLGALFSPYGHVAAEDITLLRAQGTFDHPNTLASFISTLLPFVVLKIFDPQISKNEKRIFWISFFVGLLGLLFSASRAAWVVAFLAMLFLGFFLHRRKKLKISKNWILATLILFLVFFPLLILPRIISLYQGFEQYGSGYYRLDLIKKAIVLAKRHPLGIGLGVFPAALIYEFGEFFTYPAPVHNILVQVWAATGILGLISFLLFLIFTYKRFSLTFPKSGAFFATLSFLGVASFYPFLLAPNIFEYFWLFLGIMVR
ncbi:MAG TPA: O-antigen ligase family protein [Nevskiaceae bacterium]|nr:O-antigen ligase family protein [Nevskiaceae bacterium]